MHFYHRICNAPHIIRSCRTIVLRQMITKEIDVISQRKRQQQIKQGGDNFATIVMLTAVVGTLGLVASIF